MTHSFKSTAMWHDSVGNECECEVLVEYDRFAGYNGDSVNPPEESRVEVIGVTPVVADYDIPSNAIDLEAYAEECDQHWADEIAAAADARGEAQRDAQWERF